MPDIRYVCLSDMHFGAENSLLSHLPPGETAVDPTSPSPTLTAFVESLAQLIAANEDQSVKPTLILNGDILEFALASDEVAIMAFEQFIQLAFVDRKLFDDQVIYQPGNHDHHVFETARERAYAHYVARHPPGEKLQPPWHGTSMFDAADPEVRAQRRVGALLLEAIFNRFSGLENVGVEIRYPLLGLESPDKTRIVGLHHGHYIEAIYRLMSKLKITAFPASARASTIWELEAENFAWVDFFWSTLGRSGTWGEDVGLLYDMLQDEKAIQALGHNIAGAGADALPKWIPKFISRPVLNFGMRQAAGAIARFERNKPEVGPLTPVGDADLQKFVEGPVRRQMNDEDRKAPANFTFVFGHTHKPFSGQVTYQGFASPVHVYNTGGWVVDSLKPNSLQGAVAVVLDEELRAASLHWYDQVASSPPRTVTAADAAADNPFLARLSGLVDRSTGPWKALDDSVVEELPRRYQALQTIIDRGIAQAKAH